MPRDTAPDRQQAPEWTRFAPAMKKKSAPEPHVERRERRALSHVGGAVETRGDPRLSAVLAEALAVEPDEASVMAHVHGFHTYPARLHPGTAARLIEGLAPARGRVLDPFCGSGTVLVEARRLGRRSMGLDANPLAVELSWLKTRGTSERQRAELVAAAKQCAEHADDRRLAKAGPTKRYGPADRELFEVHVLLELDGIASGIRELAKEDVQRALRLVLSSILTKVSTRPGDTTQRREAGRRIAAGYAIKLFVKKTEELARRLEEYAALLPPRSPEPHVEIGDARKLREERVDLVVSSPPYPGVYDYVEHHAARLRWLGFDVRRFATAEIGSRRGLRGLDFREAVDTWQRDFGAVLDGIARAVKPRGMAALVMADSVVGKRALYADRMLEGLAPHAGLSVLAVGSQRRPHFHKPTEHAFRERARREHVVLLGQDAGRP